MKNGTEVVNDYWLYLPEDGFIVNYMDKPIVCVGEAYGSDIFDGMSSKTAGR